MLDPGTALNVASLGYDVCKDLIKYYRRWKDCRSDVERACHAISRLQRIFASLRDCLSNGQVQLSKSQLCLVDDVLDACHEGLGRLADQVQQLKLDDHPRGLREKTKNSTRHALYPIRLASLKKSEEYATELTRHLGQIVAILNLYVTVLEQEASLHANGSFIEMLA